MSAGGARTAFKGNCFSQRVFIMACFAALAPVSPFIPTTGVVVWAGSRFLLFCLSMNNLWRESKQGSKLYMNRLESFLSFVALVVGIIIIMFPARAVVRHSGARAVNLV